MARMGLTVEALATELGAHSGTLADSDLDLIMAKASVFVDARKELDQRLNEAAERVKKAQTAVTRVKRKRTPVRRRRPAGRRA
jgi:hypothetical protein